jgi:excisionase family DNA binding protein
MTPFEKVSQHMKLYYNKSMSKITEASEYLGVSINTLKTLANNGKIKSFKTTGEHRRFRWNLQKNRKKEE